ncbi:hypothetical protein IL306_011828 [Fusarium sp. DS 682]|nr:hypothetical protein IL306_011828 [Fusarium sp. DS 682]
MSKLGHIWTTRGSWSMQDFLMKFVGRTEDLFMDFPIAVKDAVYTKDAASVRILRHAGARIFGKTTTIDFAAIDVGPETHNPHDPLRTPVGSSSGSGAAVADFQVPVALGTQSGGSLIRSAPFNGIYGFKPTRNSVSREG